MDFNWTLVILVFYITLVSVKGKPSLFDDDESRDDNDCDYENIFGINLKPVLDILFPWFFDSSEEDTEPNQTNATTTETPTTATITETPTTATITETPKSAVSTPTP